MREITQGRTELVNALNVFQRFYTFLIRMTPLIQKLAFSLITHRALGIPRLAENIPEYLKNVIVPNRRVQAKLIKIV